MKKKITLKPKKLMLSHNDNEISQEHFVLLLMNRPKTNHNVNTW